ncbi:hypothetical protein ACOCJ5_15445 [Knoellia sp. CPCC 206450]|uniref:hypothetical protein n=1 Tax=Knoellia tibetensis TaxID=3404798 RepID=UPI003B4361D6
MGIFSFHLAHVPVTVAARALARGQADGRAVPGLEHVEHLSLMTLGAPPVSLERLQLRRLAVFATWESESALDDHLASDALGRHLADGWHVRLEFVRRWGAVTALHRLPLNASVMADDEPVVAVTLAHLKLPELRRFFAWGRPVEQQVRDSPGVSLALAAVRPPRTFSTFSVWRSVAEMRDMVEGRADRAGHGAGAAAADGRHAGAMAERERRDFHSEFTTLRFRPLSEHGSWEGRHSIVPRV